MDSDGKLTYLLTVVQKLAMARTLNDVMEVVRHAARELTGADGATFVLRENDQCYYAEEDAIEPLWKGRRFPMDACISGWVMRHRQPTVIENIYADDRIPADAYRPTFVKSLVMVPIRTLDPVGAIGNYWAQQRAPQPRDVTLLSALADTTAVALENVQLYQELEARVLKRTKQLQNTIDLLQKARKEVDSLQRLLPICAWCKKIRDDVGCWHQLESYLTKQADIQFSHGICEDCTRKSITDLGGEFNEVASTDNRR